MPDFTQKILSWYQQHGRHDLPWQKDRTPYRIWVSEIMLQQTRVSTVIPYYHDFMQRFADVHQLADADIDQVLQIWAGLGYYSRARNLHKAARIIVEDFKGEFPDDIKTLVGLPGIGRSTAGAVLSLSMDNAHPVLDGNVKRVLCRYYAVQGWPGQRKIENHLWELAERHTPQTQVADYTQAIMDLGATVCTRTRPECSHCPVNDKCRAYASGLQDKIPQKKPARELPLRQSRFLIIESDGGRILLQKRPPAGIWGGLWSFPECPLDHDVVTWIKNEYGYVVEVTGYNDQIRHTFSHFHLDIIPVNARLMSVVADLRENNFLYWYAPERDNETLAMPAPVKKMVEQFYN